MLCLFSVQNERKEKKGTKKTTKGIFWLFFNTWTLPSIQIQQTLHQRSQSQTPLACLLNHTSGRYSFPAKLDSVFIGFLKSLLSLTLQSSIPFRYLMQNKPITSTGAGAVFAPEFIRDWVVRQEFCPYFLVLNFVLQLKAVLKHPAWHLEGGTHHWTPCNIYRVPLFVTLPDLSSAPRPPCAHVEQ